MNDFFTAIRRFLTEYLPHQRCCSPNTIRSYRQALNLLVTYLRTTRHLAVADIDFPRIDRHVIIEFLDWLQRERGCGATTRNQRLMALRTFFSYARLLGFTAKELSDLAQTPAPALPTNQQDQNAMAAHQSKLTHWQEQLDERHYRLNAASVALTQMVRRVWNDDAVTLRFVADGQYLKVVVQDDLPQPRCWEAASVLAQVHQLDERAARRRGGRRHPGRGGCRPVPAVTGLRTSVCVRRRLRGDVFWGLGLRPSLRRRGRGRGGRWCTGRW
jgi:hypothetical protein